ncbi:hypothetical protein COE53_12735 [Bacillus sp. AFS029533]|nr:hypothetical protein COE53_12735 [Bacillus sp. AFS029533]
MLAGFLNANGGTDADNFTSTMYLLAENEGKLGFLPIQKVNMLCMFRWCSKTYIIIYLDRRDSGENESFTTSLY